MSTDGIKYCSRCLYPETHPLNITFDSDGVCSGCRVHEEKDSLDWVAREEQLKKLLFDYKNKNKGNYDCIVPVDGGKDSYFIVDTIKNKYGLNPLLVTFNKQYNTMLGIRNLQYLKTIFGCDLLENTVNPQFAKKLTKHTLKKFGSIYWHNHIGSKTFPVQVAVRYKIPLIIWGVHQGQDQVGMFSHTDEVEMTRKYRKEHDLMGYEASDLISDGDGIFERDMLKFMYPSDKKIEEVGVRGIYLGNYIRWDSKKQHEEMIERFGYETMELNRTFDCYDHVDCRMYTDVHDYIKFIKHGYGKAIDHACREIRLKRINRDAALKLAYDYQFKKPLYLDLLLEWLEMDEKEFVNALNPLHNDTFWECHDGVYQYKITKKYISDFGKKSVALDLDGQGSELKYRIHKKKNTDTDNFRLMDKGFIH